MPETHNEACLACLQITESTIETTNRSMTQTKRANASSKSIQRRWVTQSVGALILFGGLCAVAIVITYGTMSMVTA